MKSFNCDDVFRKLREKDLGSLGLGFFYKDFLIILLQGVSRVWFFLGCMVGV